MVIALALLVALVVWVVRGFVGGGSPRPLDAGALRRQLESLTHDAAVANSLLEAELRRDPDISEVVALRRAIKRLRADRRR